MKKLLLFAALIGGLSKMTAQCTIVNSCNASASGYCSTPAINSNLVNGVENVPYSDVIQISIASTFMGSPISDVVVNSVTGLPSGLSSSTNPTNGVIPGGTDACLAISGTPAAGSAGNYSVTANVTINSFMPVSMAWYLNIGTSTGIKTISQSSSVFVSPNPATNELFVSSTSHFAKVQIIDALGKVVLTHNADYTSQTVLNISNLSKGVYFVQVNDGAKLATKKFIKD